MAESNLYQRGETWWLLARVDGHRYRESLRTENLREARRLRDKRLKEIKADVHHGERRIIFQEAAVQWLRHAKGQLSSVTIGRYARSLSMIERHLLDVPVDKIDGRLIQTIVQTRRAAGVSPATCRRDLTALSAVLSYAVALGQREGNPALDAARLLKERRDPIRLPTEESIAAICAEVEPAFAAFIVAARLTGCRQMELARAPWSAFNGEAGTLELSISTKGNKRRVIQLSPAALDHFRSLPRNGATIFCHADGSVFNRPANDFVRYSVRLARLQAEFRPFRFHDLRHLYAVEALRGGMGIYRLSRHLGHTSVKVTEVYLSFLPGDAAERAKLA
jgi:integrase/recombinase XerD